MEIILAKNFDLRSDLENYIRSKIGLTLTTKEDYIIKGIKQELNKLSLSDKSIFWGIRVEIIDKEGEKVIKKKKKNITNRGKKVKSGINIKN